MPSESSSGDADQLRIRPLSNILEEHPHFQEPRLIKIDTDGSDFEILLSSMDIIKRVHPVLFYEHSLEHRNDSLGQSLEAISNLIAAGYKCFFIYDNFGNFMETISNDFVKRFVDLNRYIMSNMLFGRQVYYVDVCAFTGENEDLADQLYKYHSTFLDSCINQAGWQTQTGS